jgi:hypothetical protein
MQRWRDCLSQPAARVEVGSIGCRPKVLHTVRWSQQLFYMERVRLDVEDVLWASDRGGQVVVAL